MLEELIEGFDGTVGVYARRLATGEEVALRALARVGMAFLQGQAPPTTEELPTRSGLPGPRLESLMARAFDEGKLAENVRAFVSAVNRAKPSGAKGSYMQKVVISSTMGPGVKIDPQQLTAREAEG